MTGSYYSAFLNEVSYEISGFSKMGVQAAKELIVYKKAYKLAMLIFKAIKGFLDEERYALTSQIRRSSRSVCMNLRETWA